MIKSFGCRETETVFLGKASRRLAHGMQKTALRKLMFLNQARDLAELAALPGHRLEAMKGDRKGQHSIRINDRWRICFRWTEEGPEQVEIVDYH